MAYNISEIKKLPVRERYRIFNELWKSIDKETYSTKVETEQEDILKEYLELPVKEKLKIIDELWDNIDANKQE